MSMTRSIGARAVRVTWSLGTPAAALVAMIATAALPVEAPRASDGRIEISQVAALRGAITAGDLPGFPVKISQPGSYVLTSGLTVTGAAESAIQLEADDVDLNLNGFTLRGPATCSGEGATLSCSGSTGTGIAAENASRVVVTNGRIRGFNGGIVVGDGARIDRLVVAGNGLDGIEVGPHSIVEDSVAYGNRTGIALGPGSSVARSIAAANAITGISGQGAGSLAIRGCVATRNGLDGIAAGVNSTIRESATSRNERDGIDVFGASTVSDNASYANGERGISAGPGDTIQRNTVRSNGSLGLALVGASGASYRQNTVTNNSGTVGIISNWIDLGGNSCNGTASCP